MTESNLYQLIYQSRNLIKDPDSQLTAEIDRILHSARTNNPKNNVTGALLFNRNSFAQVLEGSEADITLTFEKIQRDFRHSDVLVVEFGPIEKRQFGQWSMAFVGSNAHDKARFEAINQETGFDTERLTGDMVIALISAIMREEELLSVPSR